MRIFKIIVLTAILSMLVSCSKKESTPEQKQVVLTKLYSIEGFPDDADSIRCFSASHSVNSDEMGYLYIYDEKSGSIKVFDKSGKFFSSISKKGLGPEELERFDTFYINKDTVCVFENRIKLKKFLRTGEYVSVKILNSELLFIPINFSVLTDSTLLGRANNFKKTAESAEICCELAIFDKEFNKKIILAEPKVKFPDDAYTMEFVNPISAYNDKNIFVTSMSKSEYKIKVYSLSGDYVRSIKQNYIRTKYSKQEMEQILSEFPKESEHFYYFFDFKLAIDDLTTDKNGYLWVLRNAGFYGSDIEYDIIEDDRIISRFVCKNDGTKDFEKSIYIKNYFYIIDHYNNSIEVYDYEFE